MVPDTLSWSFEAIMDETKLIEKLTRERDEAREIAGAATRRADILALEDRRHVLILADVVEAHGARPDGSWPVWNDLGPAVRGLRKRAEDAEAALAHLRASALEQLAGIEAAALDGEAQLAEARAHLAIRMGVAS